MLKLLLIASAYSFKWCYTFTTRLRYYIFCPDQWDKGFFSRWKVQKQKDGRKIWQNTIYASLNLSHFKLRCSVLNLN